MVGGRSVRLDGGDGRGVRFIQCGGFRAAARAGGDVEQRVVFAFGLRGDQLHAELDVHRVCGGGVVGWRIRLNDAVAQAGSGLRAEKCVTC